MLTHIVFTQYSRNLSGLTNCLFFVPAYAPSGKSSTVTGVVHIAKRFLRRVHSLAHSVNAADMVKCILHCDLHRSLYRGLYGEMCIDKSYLPAKNS